MTRLHDVVAAALAPLVVVGLSAIPAQLHAQTIGNALTPMQISLGCALPPAVSPIHTVRDEHLHVVGAQDTIPRSLYGEHDTLVIDGGSARGIEIGQEYFVRRAVSSSVYSGDAKAIVTAGWIRVIAANQATAIAIVERSCGEIAIGDYLEPYATPVVPAAAMAVDRTGEPDFTSPGRILFGVEEKAAGGAGEYMVIDRGADQGLAPGARFAIYREVQNWAHNSRGLEAPSLPLASIGEGVVVTTSQTMAVMRILAARDAVQRGDYVVRRAETR